MFNQFFVPYGRIGTAAMLLLAALAAGEAKAVKPDGCDGSKCQPQIQAVSGSSGITCNSMAMTTSEQPARQL